jgi:hypothetical protein
MQATHARARSAAVPIAERLAGAPISWGACEVRGWGVMPSPEDVHLKDVDGGLAAEVRDGKRSLLSATQDGLFTALGRGDARIAEVLDGLQGHGYHGWLVLEQDTAITGDEPTVAGGPMRDARESIAFLHQSARTTEEINR